MNEQVAAAVRDAIGAVNDGLPDDAQIPLSADSSLLEIDSFAVTNLLVAIEESVQRLLQLDILLTDERTLDLIASEHATPLRSVGSLVEHVSRLVEDARRG